MGWPMGFMGLWMLVPLALVVGAVWVAARGDSRRERLRAEDELAAILRRRLAAGEIDVEQYGQARAALGLTEDVDGD